MVNDEIIAIKDTAPYAPITVRNLPADIRNNITVRWLQNTQSARWNISGCWYEGPPSQVVVSKKFAIY